jgi:hypothetical protein
MLLTVASILYIGLRLTRLAEVPYLLSYLEMRHVFIELRIAEIWSSNVHALVAAISDSDSSRRALHDSWKSCVLPLIMTFF